MTARDRRAVADHAGEDRVLRPEIEEVRIRAGRVGVAVPAARVDVDEPIGPLDRQRAKQQRVDDREERGVEADADAERQDRRRR